MFRGPLGTEAHNACMDTQTNVAEITNAELGEIERQYIGGASIATLARARGMSWEKFVAALSRAGVRVGDLRRKRAASNAKALREDLLRCGSIQALADEKGKTYWAIKRRIETARKQFPDLFPLRHVPPSKVEAHYQAAREMWEAGAPLAEIAVRYRIPRAQMASRIGMLRKRHGWFPVRGNRVPRPVRLSPAPAGSMVRPRRKLGDVEKTAAALFVDLRRYGSIRRLAAARETSYWTVRAQVKEMRKRFPDIFPKRRQPPTQLDAHYALAREMWASGEPVERIAEKYRTTAERMRGRIGMLRSKRGWFPPRSSAIWTAERGGALRRLWGQNLTWEEIARQLQTTASAARKIAARMGLPPRRGGSKPQVSPEIRNAVGPSPTSSAAHRA